MAKANFDSWMHSPRTILMFTFVVSFCYIVANNHIRMVQQLDYSVYWGETLYYLLADGCNITMTSILFLVTISEIPRKMGYQYVMLIRSSRNQWLSSQIIYCLWMVLCMLGITILCVSLFIIPGISPGAGWSDNARIAADIIEEEQALVPAFIRISFTPWSACLYAILPMLLFWFTMVLVILFFSLMGAQVIGVIIYALMLMATLVFMVEAFADIPMPIFYATFNNITLRWPKEEIRKFFEAVVGYGVAVAILLVGMIWRIKRVDLEFHAERRL